MVKINIDDKKYEVDAGTTILDATKKAGIEIPTMCYLKGISNQASCMLCVVKNCDNGELLTSCAVKAEEGMNISTKDKEIFEARKSALELLLSDHVGDCEAPCRIACPLFLQIPAMNRNFAANNFDYTLKVIKEEIAFPLIMCRICSAPCEKVCRRRQVDTPISIRETVSLISSENLKSYKNFKLEKEFNKNKKIAIVGAGLSGLGCAYHLLQKAYDCTIFEKNEKAGGSLMEFSEEEMPESLLETEIENLKINGAKFVFNQKIDGQRIENLKNEFDIILIANGSAFNFLEKETISKNIRKIDNNKPIFYKNDKKVVVCSSVFQNKEKLVKILALAKNTATVVDSLFIEKKTNSYARFFNSKFGNLREHEINEYLKETEIGIEERKKTEPTKQISKNEIMAEAQSCMSCDCRKPVSCKLRIYSNQYDAKQRKYGFGERKSLQKYFEHPDIVFEPEKCIKCGLCIKIANKNVEKTGLSFFGRGFDMKVDIPFDRAINEAITKSAEECVEVCPTGAISDKAFFENKNRIS